MWIYGAHKCNRWYFKFNGNECSGPMTIEAVAYNYWSSGNPELLHHRSFEGYCENISQGAVRVELWVGQPVVAKPWVMLSLGGIQYPGL